MNKKQSQAIIFKGNLSGLNQQQKNDFYTAMCHRLGMDPAGNSLKLLRLNGKEVLYGRPDRTHHLSELPINDTDKAM